MQRLSGFFEGRLERAHYFWGSLIVGLFSFAITIILLPPAAYFLPHFSDEQTIYATSTIGTILTLPLAFSLNVRRLHDLDLDGRLYILIFLGSQINNPVIDMVYWLVFLVLFLKIGTKGPNKYGPENAKGVKFTDAILNRQKVSGTVNPV